MRSSIASWNFVSSKLEGGSEISIFDVEKDVAGFNFGSGGKGDSRLQFERR